MLTAASFARLQQVHPELKRRVLQLDALIPSVSLQVTQGLRTWGQQDVLYQQGRTTPGAIVTDAAPGFSAHNFGYAVDVVPEDVIPGQPDWNVSHAAWQKILLMAPQCGLAEGAKWRTFPDNPHLYLKELPADPTDEMRAAFQNGGMAAIWESWTNLLVEESAT
jgi:peptidoglycan L-alanyl-D-glutamate endopeptidase CwlK